VIINNFVRLDPYWVTGFCDGEGCFYLRIRENIKSKIGYSVELVFNIHLHIKDKALLQAIQKLFGVLVIFQRMEKRLFNFKLHLLKKLE